MSSKLCQESDCSNKAIYNYKNEKGQKYCKEHKLDNMCNKTKKICSEIDCIKNTCKYSTIHCTDHYVKDIVIPNNLDEIDLNDKESKNKNNCNPDCIVLNCNISANYNKKGLKATYCSKHAKEIGIGNNPDQLRNVRTKLCEYIYIDGLDCIKTALYGKNNKKQFCKDHVPKSEEYIKLNKDKECLYEGCNKVPNYGYKDGIKEYCSIHKLENMIQLFQQCIIDDCNNRARYNEQGKKGAKYCSEHKLSNMSDNTKKICIEENCNNEAHYNIKNNNNGIYCNLHKKENMCSNKVKTCKYDECVLEGYYGTINDKKQYCVTHANKKIHFNYHNQPEEYYDDIKNNCLNKEQKVKQFLEDNNIKFICNKKIKNSKNNYRPDFLLEYENHCIIIEVDEDQHKYGRYSDIQEEKRISSLQNNLDKPVLIIRLNPDYYWVNKERKYTLLNDKLDVLLQIINENSDINTKKSNSILKFDINLLNNNIIKMYFDCTCKNNCNYIHLESNL
jgi:hypothetical protein